MSLIKRFVRGVMWLIAVTVLIFTGGFIGYYFVDISPHQEEISASAGKYSGDRDYDLLLQKVVRKANPPSENVIGSATRTHYAVRILSFKYLEGKHLNGLRRGVREVLWSWWLDILYTEKQIDSIWLDNAYFGNNNESKRPVYGIDRAAVEIIGLPLTELKCEQIVHLLVLSWAPSIYKNSPQQYQQRMKRVLPVCDE